MSAVAAPPKVEPAKPAANSASVDLLGLSLGNDASDGGLLNLGTSGNSGKFFKK